MAGSTLAAVVAELESMYDPAWAESWDAVGLVCGDPGRVVRKVLFAVDPVATVVDEAIEWEADLVVCHHPLYLRGTTSVAANTFKGRVVHRLIKNDIGLFTAHTNADVADPGVSDALAWAVGLIGHLRPLQPLPHDTRRGFGRIGELPEKISLREFTDLVSARLPATAGGLRVAGDPERPVKSIAVSGGAGDSLLGTARAAGVDVFLTADLRHHPASEFMEAAVHSEGPALIDAAHWATEWPWLTDAATRLTSRLGAKGTTVETRVSDKVTDAWTATAASPTNGEATRLLR